LPTLADEGDTTAADVDPRLSLPALHRVAVRRAGWLADRLGEAVAARGIVALVDDQYAMTGTGELVRTGEQIRALAELEGRERDRAERIAASMARLGLEARASTAQAEKTGQLMAMFAQALCEAAGLDWADDATRRLAQKAAIVAKERELQAGSVRP